MMIKINEISSYRKRNEQLYIYIYMLFNLIKLIIIRIS